VLAPFVTVDPGPAPLPVWLFTSGPVGKPAGRLAQSMGTDPVELPQLRAAAAPLGHMIFAGKLNPKSLPLAQRLSVRVFHGMIGDFRDWAEIRRWADGIADQLTGIDATSGC
jgi:menaquinone-dependent protoporphyrinogen oxidase